MKTIEVWSISEWDGGDRYTFSCYMDKEKVTEAEIKAKIPNCMVTPTVLNIFESFEDREAHSQHKLRVSGWNKLSAAERAALGLTAP